MATGLLMNEEERARFNSDSFNELFYAIKELGFELTPQEIGELQAFYYRGVQKLIRTVPEEQYADQLSYATGNLLNEFSYRGPDQLASFSSFRDFLRSFCPIDPFC